MPSPYNGTMESKEAETKGQKMGHNINYMTADRNVKKNRVIAEIDYEVEHVAWEECGRYHGNLTWHDDKIYPDENAAYKAIEEFDNGCYDDHAVLFHDTHAVEQKPTKKLETLRKRLEDEQKKRDEYIVLHRVTHRKSEFMGCPTCGSKINLRYMSKNVRYGYSDHLCPVCHGELRSKTVVDRIEKFEAKIEELKNQIKDEEQSMSLKVSSKAPVKWLIKYEYHS